MVVTVEQLEEWRLSRENQVLGENLPQRHFDHHKSHMKWPGLKPGRNGGKPAINHLSYGTFLTENI
jgi:hypothetical protein